MGLALEGGDIEMVDTAITLAAEESLDALKGLLPIAKKAKGAQLVVQKLVDAGRKAASVVGKGLTGPQLEKFEEEATEALKELSEADVDEAENDAGAATKNGAVEEKEEKTEEELDEARAAGRPAARRYSKRSTTTRSASRTARSCCMASGRARVHRLQAAMP